RYTFDFRRPRTPLSHLIADHEDGGHGSRREHYLEWARLVYPDDDGPPHEQTARAQAAAIVATSYSIHFHVWTQADLLELMLDCHERLGSFDIEAVRRVGLENIVILRKDGELPIPESPLLAIRFGKSSLGRLLRTTRAHRPNSVVKSIVDAAGAQRFRVSATISNPPRADR
ncbi:MAG: hypothetical protein ACLP4R_13330, partial [Solirubrobacteraceae bacterium]